MKNRNGVAKQPSAVKNERRDMSVNNEHRTRLKAEFCSSGNLELLQCGNECTKNSGTSE